MVREQKAKRTRQSFLQGALLLTAGTLLVKVIGALFKIPLSTVITEDGMGYFSTAYSFYNVLFSIATAGFPIAVSRMVSERDSLERWRDVRRIKSVSIPVFLFAGILGTVLMIFGAPFYTKVVGNTGALPAMLALAPSVLLCSMASAYRGYHEGLRNMTPTTISQVIEALSKLIFGLFGAIFVMQNADRIMMWQEKNLSAIFPVKIPICAIGAAAAILGVSIGSLFSLLFLWIYDRLGDGITSAQLAHAPAAQSRKMLAKTLVSTALPIAIGAVTMSVSGLIDASFLQTRIAYVLRTDPAPMLKAYAGCIPAENLADADSIPNYLFGCYNMALTLFMLVPSITQAFSVSALPSVTHAFAKGVKQDLQNAMETVLRITCLFAMPAGIGLSVLAQPVAALIYGDRMSMPIIGKALAIMGIAAIFAAITTPLGSMLQAVGRIELPVILVFFALLVKVALNYLLVGISEINILGGGISTLVCYVLVTIAELIALQRITGIRFNFASTVLKPTGAALLSGAAAIGAWYGLTALECSQRFTTVLAILAAVLVFIIASFLLGAIKTEDLVLLPKGEKITKTYEKYLKKIRG